MKRKHYTVLSIILTLSLFISSIVWAQETDGQHEHSTNEVINSDLETNTGESEDEAAMEEETPPTGTEDGDGSQDNEEAPDNGETAVGDPEDENPEDENDEENPENEEEEEIEEELTDGQSSGFYDEQPDGPLSAEEVENHKFKWEKLIDSALIPEGYVLVQIWDEEAELYYWTLVKEEAPLIPSAFEVFEETLLTAATWAAAFT